MRKRTKPTKSNISEVMAHLGSLGGKARDAALKPGRRSAIARLGALAMQRKNGHILKAS